MQSARQVLRAAADTLRLPLVTPDTLDRLDGVLPFQIGTGFEFPPARAELRLDHDERVRGLVVGEHVGGRHHRVFRVKLTAENVFKYYKKLLGYIR